MFLFGGPWASERDLDSLLIAQRDLRCFCKFRARSSVDYEWGRNSQLCLGIRIPRRFQPKVKTEVNSSLLWQDLPSYSDSRARDCVKLAKATVGALREFIESVGDSSTVAFPRMSYLKCFQSVVPGSCVYMFLEQEGRADSFPVGSCLCAPVTWASFYLQSSRQTCSPQPLGWLRGRTGNLHLWLFNLPGLLKASLIKFINLSHLEPSMTRTSPFLILFSSAHSWSRVTDDKSSAERSSHN